MSARLRLRRRALALAWACACLAAVPSAARATAFRLPLNGCDMPTRCLDSNKCYVTAYFDHYGGDWNCGSEMYDGHVGTDFGVQGTYDVRPVVAAAAGTVLETNDGCSTGYWGNTCGGGYGNYVKLEHADGKITIYGHLYAGSLQVAKGASVTCGQVLGRAGSSGNSTGPHLHFEVVDPTYGVDDPFSGSCGGPLSYWVGQGNYCQLPSAACEGACVPSCNGKDCGPDGCGWSCGACTSGQTCFGDGVCAVSPPDDSLFVSETIPDGTHFKPGQSFTKTWTLKNTGATPWTKAGGYSLAWQQEEPFGALPRTWPGAAESIGPNASKTWSVPMTAPLVPGIYRGYWRMDRGGFAFGATIWVEIVVDPADVDIASLMSETIDEGTAFVAGASFTKTWTFMNGGTSTWSKAGGYRFVFLRGDLMTAPTAVDLGASETVGPTKTKIWSVTMKAPATAGTYRAYWGLVHNGVPFGPEVWVQIVSTAPVPTDKDGDGHAATASGGDDCNDNDPQVFPGNAEKCDKKDNDCNGATDEGLTRDCYRLACQGTETCVLGAWVNCSAPAPSSESCNGVDDDCNGFTDDRATCPTNFGCLGGQCQALTSPDGGALPKADAGAPPRTDAGSTSRPDAATAPADAGCIYSGACTSADGCQSGMLLCSDGTCSNLKVKADGASCPGGACKAGECMACPSGEPCSYGDGCMVGTFNCSTGSPVCANLAIEADFTPCPGGLCRNGACRPIPDAGRTDAAEPAPGRDAGAAPMPDADEGSELADAGPAGQAPPAGCGCQSGPGGAWGGAMMVGVSLLLSRRRRGGLPPLGFGGSPES
ncbi:MAG TPA: NBR1-Ig-like domain-containing protein [Myxococcales bacterium]|jgi:uncharacterized protein (TIGR03382 family)